jgi:3-oxoacyl-[acyl-carrier protein] reductase
VHQTDISQDQEIAALVRWLEQTFGGVDVWINNAGADLLTGDATHLTPTQKLDQVLAVDIRGTVIASWAAVKLMRPGGGTIINMSWDHVVQGMAGENPLIYSAAKGAVASFSRSLAREVAPKIRVNVLAPGFIETAFGEGRWGRPEDVAGAALFLASDESSFLTGQTIMVNGGVVM